MGDMFDLSETAHLVEEPNLTKEEILKAVSEESIFEHYGVPIKKGLFCSKLRQDHKPTVGFYRNKQNRLIIKDFGSDFSGDCFAYVMALFNVSYYMALQIVANDFGLIHRSDLTVNKAKIKPTGTKFEEQKSAVIQIQTRTFKQSELDWWGRYGITQSTLTKFRVYPVDAVWLNGNLFYTNTSEQPVFGYFGGILDGVEQWRIYWPKRKLGRFISNWKGTFIQGAQVLPKEGEYIVVTKSLKDVMCLHEFGIPAIAPCSENLFLTEAQYKRLKEHFKRIYLLYDNDIPGIHATNKIHKQFPDVKCLLLNRDKAKDISDFRKLYGYRETLALINKAKEYYGET